MSWFIHADQSAYPTGEGIGDEGYLTHLELRYQLGRMSLETLVARRLVGGNPQSDPHEDPLAAWLIFSYAF